MWFLFFLFLTPLAAEEIRVEVIDPVYKDGSLSTQNGGVIHVGDIRIQGRSISINEENGERILRVKGDLLLVDKNKFFVGDSFSYNLATKQGTLENGVCNVERFFVGGKTINFNEHGALEIEKAFVTTFANKATPLAIRATEMTLDKDSRAKAKGITPNVGNTPFFYLPSYSANLAAQKEKKESPIQYRAYWESGQGPLLVLRSRILDTGGFKAFWRGEYRLARGAGTALEFDYQEPVKKLFSFASRNFYAYDTFYNDLKPDKFKSRYRIQGSFDSVSENKKIETFARWDALSDRLMRSDFPTQMFELQTLGRTEGFIKSRYDGAFTSLYARPRINAFQGFKQELPTLTVALKPYTIPKTGLIFENYFKLAYLDYAYADKFVGKVQDFRSGRLETSQSLARPLHLGPIHTTPKIGFQGIYYSASPQEKDHFQSLFHYSLSSFTTFEKGYAHFTHAVKPYVDFQGLTKPSQNIHDVYMFSVQDGYHTINQFKVGLKNSLFARKVASSLPEFSSDLYAYNFYNAKTFSKAFPKGYLDLTWSYPKLTFQTNLGWNFEKNTLDHTNFALSWTVNEYFAASLELRNRGKYEWRKDQFSNYTLDVTRPISELANSPLSDERTSIFMRWQLQLAPTSHLQVLNHIGWRPNQPFYHESKFDFYTLIASTWKLRLTYTRTTSTNQYSFGVTSIL